MAEGRLLRKLISAGVGAENEEFRRVAAEVVKEERAKRHHLLANDLERILDAHGPARSRVATPIVEVPKDRERGFALVDIREPVRELRHLVLSDANRSSLEEVLLERSRAEVLASYGLEPATKLLFCGPPGCGKTSAAEALATELGTALVTVRIDAVVSSYLGETATNIRKVFDFLECGAYVALFDEFDAFGKEREDASEHGELKRLVNAFLQMMDGYRGRTVLVAATNHERLLDRALWRRFDEVLFFERPSLDQVRQLLALKLQSVRHELPLSDRGFLNRFTGLTHADIERVLRRAMKATVLKGREFVTVEAVEEARRREEQRQQALARP
jgi:SpoVK/Ycf46/Vps4 family AAA+-type ATPase